MCGLVFLIIFIIPMLVTMMISYVIEIPTSFAASTMALAADGEDDEDDKAGTEESHPGYCQYSNTLRRMKEIKREYKKLLTKMTKQRKVTQDIVIW